VQGKGKVRNIWEIWEGLWGEIVVEKNVKWKKNEILIVQLLENGEEMSCGSWNGLQNMSPLLILKT